MSKDNDEARVDDIIVLQKYVVYRKQQSKKPLDSPSSSPPTMMMSELPTVVRVSSKCGFGKPTVSVHKPKQIDPACLLSDPGRDSSTEDSRNTSHYLVRKDNSEIDTYVGYPPKLVSSTISRKRKATTTTASTATSPTATNFLGAFMTTGEETRINKLEEQKKRSSEISSREEANKAAFELEELYAEAIGRTRKLVHLLSSTYTKLQLVELTCDFIYDGKKWILINVHGFKVKGLGCSSSTQRRAASKSRSTSSVNSARVLNASNKRRQQLSPTKRAQTASSVRLGMTTLPSLLAAANGEPVALRHDHAERRRPATTGSMIKNKTRCVGKYCHMLTVPSQKERTKVKHNSRAATVTMQPPKGVAMCSLLYKSIVEDKCQGTTSIMPRDRAIMYTTVLVCKSCHIQYTTKDQEREKIRAKANVRAQRMLKLANQKYQKYGSGAEKIKAGASRVEMLYEKSKEKLKLPPSLSAALRGEKLSKNEMQSLVKQYSASSGGGDDASSSACNTKIKSVMTTEDANDAEAEHVFEQEYAATAAMEDVNATAYTQNQLLHTIGEDDDNDNNVCLLCEEGVDACKCELSPRVDVRALIGRVVPDMFV